MPKKLIILSMLIIFTATSAFALFGTRPMGMGGAFTAVSDDANAAYWNPAGVALNPEVAITASTMLNNRNTWVGDNVGNLKFCYEAEMNPFEWIIGIGAASALALEGAQYLSDQGIVKKGWGREGETTSRDQSMAAQVKGSAEVVSLTHQVNETVKIIAHGAKEAAKSTAKEIKNHSVIVWSPPWYHTNYDHPYYWQRDIKGSTTKAQFALGLSWLNDYNPPLDQNSNWYTVSLASGFEERVAVGANINIYNLKKISADTKGIGGDLDLGVIVKPVEYISFGLVTKGILTTDISWQDGSKTRYEMLVNGGVAIKPFYSLTLAADAKNIFNQGGNKNTFHYGAEAVIVPGVLARAGLSDGSKTAGLSVLAGSLIVDYAILGGSYNRTQMLGATWRF